MLSLQTINTFDTSLFYWFQSRRQMHAGVTETSRYISRLGDGVIYILLGMLLAVFEPQDGAAFLRSSLLAFLIELPLYFFLKNTIRRDRPCEQLSLEAVIKPSDKFGFPSGHAAAAFVFATVLAQTYPPVAFLVYGIAVLIGISRILLGVHYPADIVAGAVVGITCGFLSTGSMGV